MEKLENITFYMIDKTIRSYRSYMQKRLRENGYKITIDQWLIIKAILEYPDIQQQELAGKVFKDNASVTRIIELLVKSNYVERAVNQSDRRRSHLQVTESGKVIIEKVQELILQNRKVTLSGVSERELEMLNSTLIKIIQNCQS